MSIDCSPYDSPKWVRLKIAFLTFIQTFKIRTGRNKVWNNNNNKGYLWCFQSTNWDFTRLFLARCAAVWFCSHTNLIYSKFAKFLFFFQTDGNSTHSYLVSTSSVKNRDTATYIFVSMGSWLFPIIDITSCLCYQRPAYRRMGSFCSHTVHF